MSTPNSGRVSPLAHPNLHCLIMPLVLLLLGALLAAYLSVGPLGWPGWAPWASLAMGFVVGAAASVPQRRSLHTHRDFVAEQSLTDRTKDFANEVKWMRVLWPTLMGLVAAIVVAWWLRWPAAVAAAGALGSPLFVYRECARIHVLAKRKASDLQGT